MGQNQSAPGAPNDGAGDKKPEVAQAHQLLAVMTEGYVCTRGSGEKKMGTTCPTASGWSEAETEQCSRLRGEAALDHTECEVQASTAEAGACEGQHA